MKIEDALMFQSPSLELQRAAASEIARLKAALLKTETDNLNLAARLQGLKQETERSRVCVGACEGYDTEWLVAITELYGGLPGFQNEIGAQNAEQLARHLNDGVHELRDSEQGPSVADDVCEQVIARIEFFQDDGDESMGMPARAFLHLAEADKQEGTFLARAVRQRDTLHLALYAIMQWAANRRMPFDLAFDARMALAGEVKVKLLADKLDVTVEDPKAKPL